jgi:hypothetical protein
MDVKHTVHHANHQTRGTMSPVGGAALILSSFTVTRT